jgi:hypothetical protein
MLIGFNLDFTPSPAGTQSMDLSPFFDPIEWNGRGSFEYDEHSFPQVNERSLTC